MAWSSFARAVALALSVVLLLPAGAEPLGLPLPLPPVTVPLPPPEAPEAPSRRDPTGARTVVEAAGASAEAKVASDLVATAPGVILHQRGGLLQTSQLTLRGASGNGVLVLLDGIPLNGPGGAVDLSRIPLPVVERVEVLRGAAARYQPGGLGGVVNVITRRPSEGGQASGALTGGSFGTALLHGSASGPLPGGTGLLVLHGARSEGDFPFAFDSTPNLDDDRKERRWRRNNDVAQGGALLRYRRPLGGDATLDAMAELGVDRRGLAGTAGNPTDDARMSARRLVVSARALVPQQAGELSVRAHLRQDGSTLEGGLFGPRLPQKETSAGLDVEATRLLGGRHGVWAVAQLGADALAEPGGRDPSWLRAGVGLGDEVLLFDGQAALVPSLRIDLTGPFVTLSPKLGARAELPFGLELLANAGQAHRPPSFLELYVVQGSLLPNPDLRPERALFADLGLSHRTLATRFALTAFRTLYQDLIAYEYHPPFLARPYNFQTALVQGLEAEGEARWGRWLQVGSSYTLTSSQNLRDDPRYYRKQLPYRPRHRLTGRLAGGGERLRLRAELDLQSGQYLNRTNTVSLPSRAFVHAGVTAQVPWAPKLKLSVDAKNLLDQQTQDLDGYPLPGRALFMTLSFALETAGRKPEGVLER